jgi:hypothetical protein
MRTTANPLTNPVTDTEFAQLAEAGYATMAHAHHGYQGPYSFTPDEATHGALDSVFVYWNRSVPQIEISELRVTKID